MARNMTRNAAASKKITASVPKTHRQTAPQLKDPPQLHTRPTKSTTSLHSHPPGCPKSPLLKVQSAFWAILAGVELTEGYFSDRLPHGHKKEVPTECYFNRDFRKAAAAYSPTWWGSTIGASELNFSVRYGKRWILTAITAAVCYLREISRLKSWLTQKISGY